MIMTIAQLLCLTSFELEEMRLYLTRQANELPPESDELRDTLKTLENIRLVLAMPELRRRTKRGRGPFPAP